MAVTATEKVCSNCGTAPCVPKRPHCSDCYKQYRRELYKNRTEEQRQGHLSRQRKHRYGLDTIAYNEYINNIGKCQICDNKENLCVDHDHLTGENRGVLCRGCNLMIGLAKDNVRLLSRAVLYLENTGLSEFSDSYIGDAS